MPNMIGPTGGMAAGTGRPLPAASATDLMGPARGASRNDDFFATLKKLGRHYWIVLAAAAVALVLALIAVRSLTPLYTATAEILIGAPVNDAGGSLAPAERQSVDSEAVQSQARIVTSRIIASRVVDQLALDKDPEFNPYLRDSRGLVDRLFGRSAEEKDVPREKQAALTTDVLLSKVSAGPTDRSHVLNVQVETEEPERAARIANAFANLYIEQLLVRQTTMAQQANTWLEDQIGELRKQLDADERAVEEYRKERGLYEANTTTVTDQQLAELNTQLVVAESDKAEAEARLSQAEQVLNSGGELDSIPEVVNSPLIQALEEKQAEIAREAAELSSTFGPMHPRIKNIEAQQADTQRKIDAEVRKIVSSVRNSALTAQARYNAIKDRLEAAKSEVSESNVDSVELRQLQREADASRALFENFLDRYKRNSAQEEFKQATAWIISPATAPVKPSFPPKKPILAGTTLMGLLIGALLVLLMESLDRTFRTAEDVMKTTGLPALALVPTFRKAELAGNKAYDPSSPFSESIYKLHTRLMFSQPGDPPKVTMFTSAVPDEGKSRISVSLARQLAYAGRRVIIVDGDLRRPSVHTFLGAKNGPGLIELLNGTSTPDEAVYRDEATGVHAIFAGRSPNGENMLPDVQHLRMLLASLSKHYDTVILDAPPVLVGAEVVHYAQMVDATAFVVQWGKTQKEVVLDGLRQLTGTEAHIAGVVLAQINPRLYKRYAEVGLHYRYPHARKTAARLR